MKRIALIDNNDSFTHNLVHLAERDPNVKVDVFFSDLTHCDQVSSYHNIILSPGPGLPSHAGVMPNLLKKFAEKKNILGICLGMQAIGERFNSPLKNLKKVMHGIATPIHHSGNDLLFNDIPAVFNAGRYHSWVIDKERISSELVITAEDEQGEIMGIKHSTYNIRGVQFHPESILSEYGIQIMTNWIKSCS